MGGAAGIIGGIIGGAAGAAQGRDCAKAFEWGMKCDALGTVGGAVAGAGIGTILGISIQPEHSDVNPKQAVSHET